VFGRSRVRLAATLASALATGMLTATVLAPTAAHANPDSPYISYDGQRGRGVWCVQEGLRRYAGFTGTVDGVYGPQTRQAVINLQAFFGLRADGVVGPRTGDAIRTMFYLDGPVSYIDPKLFWEVNCQAYVPTIAGPVVP
jgi:peptidoglycan hydrolase-like protein with peptidoglycan-binding domain